MNAKIILVPFCLIGLMWGTTVLSGNYVFAFLKAFYLSVFWGYPILIILDLFWSVLGKNQKVLNDFYKSMHRDLLGLLGTYALFLIVFSLDDVEYSGAAIDLAMTGLPLTLIAISNMFAISRLRSGEKPLKSSLIKKSIMLSTIFIISSIFIVIEISSGKLEFSHSLWIQITIFCISLYLYLESARIKFYLSTGKFAWSSLMRKVFQNSELQLHEQTRTMIIELNRHEKER